MKNFQETDFKIEITGYSQESTTVYYELIVAFREKKWKLVKRFREFEELHSKLNKILLNMPYLPAKSLLKLKGQEIDKRRLDLEKYIRALCLRKDVVQLPDFLNFIDFESYNTNEIFSPKELGGLTNLSFSVSDFIFVKEANILFVALADMSILSKMDDIFSSFTSKGNNDIRGSVHAYKVEGRNKFSFNLLWKKDFKNPTTCLYWDQALTFLAIGFDEGSCECIRVSTEHNYQEFDEFCIVKRHTSRVTGCGFFSLLATLYTISKDKTLVVTDITKTVNFALEEKTFLNELTYLLVDNPNKRMFISDSVGNIHIYGLDIPLQIYHKISCEYPQFFSTLFMDVKKRFLLAGSTQGMIYIYELGKPGKEKFISMTSKIETSKNLKSLAFSIYDRNLYFNYGNSVIFMDSARALPYYSLEKHKAEVVKLAFLDSEKILITASKDKTIKFWRLKDSEIEDINKSSEEVKEQSEKSVINNPILLKSKTQENPLKDRELHTQKTEEISTQAKLNQTNNVIDNPLMKSEPHFEEKKNEYDSKFIESEDDDELKGWHDDSTPQIPYQQNANPLAQNNMSIPNQNQNNQNMSKNVNVSQKQLLEEEKNDLKGWDSNTNSHYDPLSYFSKKTTPVIEKKIPEQTQIGKTIAQTISSTLNKISGKKEENVKKNEGEKKIVKPVMYEEEDDLNGWSQ